MSEQVSRPAVEVIYGWPIYPGWYWFWPDKETDEPWLIRLDSHLGDQFWLGSDRLWFTDYEDGCWAPAVLSSRIEKE